MISEYCNSSHIKHGAKHHNDNDSLSWEVINQEDVIYHMNGEDDYPMKSSTKHPSTCNEKGPPMKCLLCADGKEDDNYTHMLNKDVCDKRRKKSLTQLVLINVA